MLEKGTVVFGNWTVEEEIGSGAFGTVYKIKKEEFGRVYYSAMKVLHIPRDKEEHKRLRSEGMDDASISTYYSQVVQDFVSEIELLSSLDGITNIVDYKDHIIEPNDNMGYTIYIKMQLLTPVSDTLLNSDGSVRFMDVKEIINLGVDICSALEVCEKRNIIHRDIKIDNIFVSENGDYKLGDFGIAKQLEATQGEMSKKGTLLYMAPEVFRGEKYDKTADIYSLGVVLYRLLNKNRAPFFPNYPNPIKFSDKETANTKRLKGEEFPDIIGIGPELNEVLKKACAFNPKDRYLSANEFKSALNGVTLSMIFLGTDEPTVDSDVSVFEEPVNEDGTVGVFSDIPVVIVDDNAIDEDKTESVFDMAPVIPETEKTESVFSETPSLNCASADVIENEADNEDELEKTESVFAESPSFDATTTNETELESANEDELEKTESVFNAVLSKNDDSSNQDGTQVKNQESIKKRNNVLIPIIVVLVLAVCVVVGIFSGNNDSTSISDDTTIEEIVEDTTKKNNKKETNKNNSETAEDINIEEYVDEEDVNKPAIYFSNIDGLSFEEAEKKLNNAGVSCYVTKVYSSSYDCGTVVGAARDGWTESSYAYEGDNVELLFSCGPVEDSWSCDNLPSDTSDIIVEDIYYYDVILQDSDMGQYLIEVASWETVWDEYVQHTASPINESDFPEDNIVTLSYLGDYIDIIRYVSGQQRWRPAYEIWD